MSTCCQTNPNQQGTNKFFTRFSKKYAKRFRKGKLEKVQRLLLEGVRKEPVTSKEILDIGCGVGSLHLTLLKEGATRAVGVDMAEGMLDKAKQFAAQFGMSEKTEYLLGDFVERKDQFASADITLLDKVVCCYEDVKTLIDTSTQKTKLIYAFSHPRRSFLMKVIFKTQIFVCNLLSTNFRPYWHDWLWVRSLVSAHGFELVYENATLAWQVAVYKRTGAR